jgi:hypothetical protein
LSRTHVHLVIKYSLLIEESVVSSELVLIQSLGLGQLLVGIRHFPHICLNVIYPILQLLEQTVFLLDLRQQFLYLVYVSLRVHLLYALS